MADQPAPSRPGARSLQWRAGWSDVVEGGSPPTADWRLTVRRRVLLAAVGLALWTAGIEARLIYLQVVQYDDLVARAERQQLRTVTAPAKRGELLDRDGRVLAVSVDADSVYAVPTEVGDPDQVASSLCAALDDCSPQEQEKIADRLRKPRAFEYVRRQVLPDEARRVAALHLEGVGFLKESRRYYPNKELAAHVLGYVGIDNQGLNGVEWTYDSQIRGRQGKILIQTDARRRAFSRIERPPTAGATLELTIDKYLQYIAERELRAGVLANRADGGTIIIMDPNTGEVLALANLPTFNPNVFARANEAHRRNRATQDIYEPGSAFKVVTASAALEEEVVKPGDPIDVSEGMIQFGSRQIDDPQRYDTLSFADVIINSSNVGTIKVGLKLGPEQLGRYARRFGFGQTLSRDFQGESSGIVWDPAHLNDSGVASMAIGYQVAVTPLQMAAAVSAVANGGELLEPRLVHAVLRDNLRVEMPRRVIRRAISQATAAELTAIMEGVVERGTAMAARIPQHTVAGKTGTAWKWADGQYSRSDHNSTFVGFLPSRDPVLTVLVVIDSPRADGYEGGTVAAPVFKHVADAALRHLGVAPTTPPRPPLLVARRGRPMDEPPRTAPRTPAVLTPVAGLDPGQGLMPDLRGLSARTALRVLARVGVTVQLKGEGSVVDQAPAPGSLIDWGAACTLWLQRRVTAAEARSNS